MPKLASEKPTVVDCPIPRLLEVAAGLERLAVKKVTAGVPTSLNVPLPFTAMLLLVPLSPEVKVGRVVVTNPPLAVTVPTEVVPNVPGVGKAPGVLFWKS